MNTQYNIAHNVQDQLIAVRDVLKSKIGLTI